MHTALQSRALSCALRLLATLFILTSPLTSRGAPLDELIKSAEARALGETVRGETSATVFRDPPNENKPAANAEIVDFEVRGSTGLLLRAFAEDRRLVGGTATGVARVTFTVREPTRVSMLLAQRRGTVAVSLDDEPLTFARVFSTTVQEGTHTVTFAATNSRGVSEQELRLTIAGKAPDPDEFAWKNYADGAWETANNWKSGKVPGEGDVAIFDLLPGRGVRSVPLPFINVRSAGARTAGGLEISRSAVELDTFSLDLLGTSDAPDALFISDSGQLSVNAADGAARVDFTTAGAAIGGGRELALGGESLGDCQLFIGPGVVWKNTGNVGIGERMGATVVIETRLADGTPSACVGGDVFLGAQRGATASLNVSGRFASGGLLAGAREETRTILFVDRGGLLSSSFAQGGSGPESSLRAFIDDAPNAEAGYTSRGERSTWQIGGLLSLAGEIGSAPGTKGGGFALVNVLDGGLLTASAAAVGEGSASSKPVAGRSATVVASGFDAVDEEPSEVRIAGTLTVGEGCAGTVAAESGGLVSARKIHVKTLGRLRCKGTGSSGLLDVSAIATPIGEPGDIGLQVDGGGRVDLAKGGIIDVGDIVLGGADDQRAARFRIDGTTPGTVGAALLARALKVGDGLGFPARFDFLGGVIVISADSDIAQNSIFTGFGVIATDSDAAGEEVTLRNDGRIIVPPGAGRVLDVRQSFRLGPTGEVTLTVNKTNDASVAPLKVGGPTVDLSGKVTLQFSGGRIPRKGEAFALINAPSSAVTNNAEYRVAGARGAFDIVVDDFGVALVFK